eukprot:1161344-Pelagomonas_calceolata.AAC.3
MQWSKHTGADADECNPQFCYMQSTSAWSYFRRVNAGSITCAVCSCFPLTSDIGMPHHHVVETSSSEVISSIIYEEHEGAAQGRHQ